MRLIVRRSIFIAVLFVVPALVACNKKDPYAFDAGAATDPNAIAATPSAPVVAATDPDAGGPPDAGALAALDPAKKIAAKPKGAAAAKGPVPPEKGQPDECFVAFNFCNKPDVATNADTKNKCDFNKVTCLKKGGKDIFTR